jgi:hypothetical protein
MSDEASRDPAGIPDASWDERRLCPDGGCLGVVGGDGVCNVCGKVDPEAPKGGVRALVKVDGDEDDGDEGDDDGDGDDGEGDGEEDPASRSSAGDGAGDGDDGDDWQRRRLCEDGGCIGVVIGGRCTTCGKQQ